MLESFIWFIVAVFGAIATVCLLAWLFIGYIIDLILDKLR